MTLLYLNSDQMGQNNPELGRILMGLFLDKLATSETSIDVICCLNEGIRLTTEGSSVLDSLKAMVCKGTKIGTCITCLDYLKLRDKLIIGSPITMVQSVEFMRMADKIISP